MTIDSIKAALAAGPTQGPWKVFNGTDVFPDDDDREGRSHIADCAMSGWIDTETQKANAALIAACNPVVISELIFTLEAQQKRIADMEEAISKAQPHVAKIERCIRINDDLGRVVTGQTEAAQALADIFAAIQAGEAE